MIVSKYILGLGLGVLMASTVAAEPWDPFLGRPVFSSVSPKAQYGKGWFPEPLLAPEMDREQEVRLDWLHTEKRGVVGDNAKAEVEWSFGLLTVEAEFKYERATDAAFDPVAGRTARSREEGIGSVELSARYPLFQHASSDGQFEYNLVGAFELALPTRTDVSKDTEIVPQLFQLMRFGKNVSFQTSVGYSALIGAGEGGVGTLEYSAVVGYSLDHLPIPAVQRIIPIAELVGELPFNGEGRGINNLTGVVGARIMFGSMGVFQPRLGIGYVFPVSSAAHDDFRWGIITSLAFEF